MKLKIKSAPKSNKSSVKSAAKKATTKTAKLVTRTHHSVTEKPHDTGYSRSDILEIVEKMGKNPMAWFAGHIDDAAVKRCIDDKRTYRVKAHNSRKILCILGAKRQNGVMKARVYVFAVVTDGEFCEIRENINTGKKDVDTKAVASLTHMQETYGRKNVFLGPIDAALTWVKKTGATVDCEKGKSVLNG